MSKRRRSSRIREREEAGEFPPNYFLLDQGSDDVFGIFCASERRRIKNRMKRSFEDALCDWGDDHDLGEEVEQLQDELEIHYINSIHHDDHLPIDNDILPILHDIHPQEENKESEEDADEDEAFPYSPYDNEFNIDEEITQLNENLPFDLTPEWLDLGF